MLVVFTKIIYILFPIKFQSQSCDSPASYIDCSLHSPFATQQAFEYILKMSLHRQMKLTKASLEYFYVQRQ